MKKIAVGVLAGGKSTRMGENKALLQINGKRFLNQICGELGDFSQVIISAARKGDYEDLGSLSVYIPSGILLPGRSVQLLERSPAYADSPV